MSEITTPAARRTRRTAAATLALALGAGTLTGVGAAATAEPAQAAQSTYTVQAGQGWWQVSQSSGVPLSTLFSLNGMSLNTMLHPGMVLKTSGASATTAPAPSAGGTVTVRSGEGWWAVSQRAGVSLSTLFSLNDMSLNTMLHPGMVLKTSGTATPTTPAPSPVVRQSAPAPTTSAREIALDYVMAKVNSSSTYYAWGGTGPYGFDCSGLMKAAFTSAGVSIPRLGNDQYLNAKSYVPLSQAQPGDLVFWANQSTGRVYHVAMYIGNGKVAHALNENDDLDVSSIDIMASNRMAMVARY